MQNQYINEWFNIPELHVNQILFSDGDELHLEAVPVAQRQCCPVCQSMQHVIRKGNNGRRIVRHLSVFEKKNISECTGPSFAVFSLRSWIRMDVRICWTEAAI